LSPTIYPIAELEDPRTAAQAVVNTIIEKLLRRP